MFYSTQIDSREIDRSADELMININVPLDYIIQIICCRSNTFIDITFLSMTLLITLKYPDSEIIPIVIVGYDVVFICEYILCSIIFHKRC